MCLMKYCFFAFLFFTFHNEHIEILSFDLFIPKTIFNFIFCLVAKTKKIIKLDQLVTNKKGFTMALMDLI